jgi:hypothetical protein
MSRRRRSLEDALDAATLSAFATLPTLTIPERAQAFRLAYRHFPAACSWPVREQGRDVLYAVWVIGNDYRNRTRFYGQYPHGFLDRLLAFFPEITHKATRAGGGELAILHAFSGSMRKGPYVRLDLQRTQYVAPDVLGNVYDAPALLGPNSFDLAIADPPYSPADAVKYGVPMIDRLRATRALAQVVRPGGYLAWFDQTWPMHRKTEWVTVGRIFIRRSTNHRTRELTLFQRVGGAA